MTDDHAEPLPMVRNPMNEWCVVCKDWAGPTWTVTWPDGHTEIRCGIHGGADPVNQ